MHQIGSNYCAPDRILSCPDRHTYFQDGSWVKTNLSYEQLYCELDCLILQAEFDYSSSLQLMHIAAVLAVTLPSIHKGTRFKKGVFCFCGCLPESSAAAAENAVTPVSKIRIRG